ncbi:uncharacterized protein I206_100875 [Kwoniella pini CBS 10737]|uniref:Uncharacterized protein n=1 Tax=Kwoniella pini CBS 10737 TaxID=1296096 RepID=A0A1B9ICS3_9TREE|nr:uncharacterized protein I206_00451 [Kwoniella pini CBS 10737]OCF53150.1 hypothetical protein I206_00451 [Kwoniella pini CBS 10737]
MAIIVNERSCKSTQFPSTPTSISQNPSELSIVARENYSNLRASLVSASRNISHNRGISSLSTISSVNSTSIVTPIEEELTSLQNKSSKATSIFRHNDCSVEQLTPRLCLPFEMTRSPEDLDGPVKGLPRQIDDYEVSGRKRSSTLASGQGQSFASSEIQGYLRKTRSNTIDDVASPSSPTSASRIPSEAESEGTEEKRKVGTLSRD